MGLKRAFTLLEVMLTIAIIAIAGTGLLFRAKPMLDHYRFEKGVGRLKEEILYTKHLAEIASADVELHIKHNKRGVVLERVTDEPLNLGSVIGGKILIDSIFTQPKQDVTVLFLATGGIDIDIDLSISNGVENVSLKDFFSNLSFSVEKKKENCYDEVKKVIPFVENKL